MHGYITSHGGDLDENKHSKEWKLSIHGYKTLHGAISTKMIIIKRYQKDILFSKLIFWDGFRWKH